jgi:hypothetical protein
MDTIKQENMRRWRLILGSDVEDKFLSMGGDTLNDRSSIMDQALAAIYDKTTQGSAAKGAPRSAGLGKSAPVLAKWLGDIRRMFPSDVVSIIQQDAIERKGLRQLLLEPETLETIKPDISMVGTLMALKGQIPEKAKESARQLVKAVVEDIMRRMEQDLRRAVTGALNKKEHSPLPNVSAIDWKRTIRRNLKNYDPDSRRIIPEKFWFYQRARKSKDWTVILDIDQSGSMAESIIYSSVMGSIFASMPALDTHVIAFDTEVVDLTEMCRLDPVDMLFGIQLGGGTNINKSVEYCQQLITEPRKTLFILISDLYEGGVAAGLLRRLDEIRSSGCKAFVLLALSDSGVPSYDEALGKKISALGIPSFACSPDRLPELVEGALKGFDLSDLAGRVRVDGRGSRTESGGSF